MKMVMEVITVGREYSDQILEIFNEAILNSTALFDYTVRTRAYMAEWFASKEKEGFPVIGIVGANDELLAFGTYGPFRRWPAYHYSIEHSVYVKKEHRGKGFGKRVLEAIVRKAEEQGYHTIVAGICSENVESIEMHRKQKFEFVGRVKEAGYKFNRWLDLDFYQLLLKTPRRPGEAREL